MKLDNKGFSLIELMVVVTIIGILSAIAVPQYGSYKRTAKQASAQTELAAIYTSQKIFKAEKGTFYRNLPATGYKPEGTLSYRIIVNSTSGVTSPIGMTMAPLRYNESSTFARNYHDTYYMCGNSFSVGINQNCQYDTDSAAVSGSLISGYTSTGVTRTTFTAGAYAKLGGSSASDAWTINENRNIVNVRNGAI